MNIEFQMMTVVKVTGIWHLCHFLPMWHLQFDLL